MLLPILRILVKQIQKMPFLPVPLIVGSLLMKCRKPSFWSKIWGLKGIMNSDENQWFNKLWIASAMHICHISLIYLFHELLVLCAKQWCLKVALRRTNEQTQIVAVNEKTKTNRSCFFSPQVILWSKVIDEIPKYIHN